MALLPPYNANQLHPATDTATDTATLQLLSDTFGWMYFVIWSISFYGQVLTLLTTKNAKGMSFNYVLINSTGYFMYTIYNLYGYCLGDNPQTGNVETSDILFSLHSIFAYSITMGLFFYYPHELKVSQLTKGYLLVQWGLFWVFGLEVLWELYTYFSGGEGSTNPSLTVTSWPNTLRSQGEAQSHNGYRSDSFLHRHQSHETETRSESLNFWHSLGVFTFSILGRTFSIGFFSLLGYFKMLATLLKHPPQIYYNYKRQSTKGWSISMMIMDYCGGLFSFLQLAVRKIIEPELHLNWAKLSLSCFSMLYDLCYMVQHYYLYPERKGFEESKNDQGFMKLKEDENNSKSGGKWWERYVTVSSNKRKLTANDVESDDSGHTDSEEEQTSLKLKRGKK